MQTIVGGGIMSLLSTWGRRALPLIMVVGVGCWQDATAPARGGTPRNVRKINDDQQGMPSKALGALIGVQVTNESGGPVSGVTVVFTAENGTTVTPITATTDAQGIAYARWTMGGAMGAVTATASAGPLAAVTFRAHSGCTPNGTLAVIDTVAGALDTTDCVFSGDGSRVDAWLVALAATTALDVEMSSSFDSFLLFYRDTYTDTADIVAQANNVAAGQFNARLRVLAAPGTYVVAANNFTAALGSYSLFARSWNGSIDACNDVFITPGVTTDQLLVATDCVEGGFYADYTYLYLRQGEQVRVDMTSAAFDAVLRANRLGPSGFVPVVFDDNSGGGTNARLSLAAAFDQYIQIVPTSKVAGGTGAYTLSVTTLAGPP